MKHCEQCGRSHPKVRWRILDVWAFPFKGDSRANDQDAQEFAASLRHNHMGTGVQVRKFVRTMKAGGAVIDCWVVVARKPIPYHLGSDPYPVEGSYRVDGTRTDSQKP